MVVRINTGKSIRGVLRYNELKRESGQAKLIATGGFLPGSKNLSTVQLAKRFENRLSLNRRTKTNVLHISLNFSSKDKLDSRKLEEIARDYLKGIGFGNQPFLLYQHFDAGHPHVHVVTVNIDEKGKRIETHNLGKNQSECVRKELEINYGLVKAEGQDLVLADLRMLQKVTYGTLPTKAAINAVVTHVVHNYAFSSLQEFNAILRCFDVMVSRGAQNCQQYKNGGLIYRFIDKQGSPIGIGIKASALRINGTLNRLERRFPNGKSKKLAHLSEVQEKVFASLNETKRDKLDLLGFQQKLKKRSIDSQFLYTATDFLYGVTYVDHRKGLVYKGSELGTAFGASGIRQVFIPFNQKPNKATTISNQDMPDALEEKAADLVFEITNPLLVSEIGDISDSPFAGPSPKRRKKKKKGEKD